MGSDIQEIAAATCQKEEWANRAPKDALTPQPSSYTQLALKDTDIIRPEDCSTPYLSCLGRRLATNTANSHRNVASGTDFLRNEDFSFNRASAALQAAYPDIFNDQVIPKTYRLACAEAPRKMIRHASKKHMSKTTMRPFGCSHQLDDDNEEDRLSLVTDM